MSYSNEILSDYASNPKLNYYASNVQDMARELIESRQRIVALESENAGLKERLEKGAVRLAKDAVDQYRRMQRELYSVHHSFDGPVLDTLAMVMQDAYGSPTQQQDEAIRRANAAIAAGGKRS